MSRRLRIAFVTLLLTRLGFLCGVLALGGGGALGLLLRPEGTGIAAALLPLVAILGGVLGAVLLPVGAWLLLRRAPLWQVCLVPAVCAAAGEVLEWTLWNQTTFAGAGLGLFVGVVLLALWQQRAARSGVRRSTGAAVDAGTPPPSLRAAQAPTGSDGERERTRERPLTG
jgi:hypothetical protein